MTQSYIFTHRLLNYSPARSLGHGRGHHAVWVRLIDDLCCVGTCVCVRVCRRVCTDIMRFGSDLLMTCVVLVRMFVCVCVHACVYVSLWDHPAMISLRKERWSRLVDFPQCAFGLQFQKLTTFMYSSDLEHLLQPLGHMRCTHNHKVKASAHRESPRPNRAKVPFYAGRARLSFRTVRIQPDI